MTLYGFAWHSIRLVAGLLWQTTASGWENVPMSGPLIIACNHVSNIDPPILGAYAPRKISYMAKKELFEMPVLGALISRVGAYPVDRRGSAASAVKRSVEILRAGGCVGIFPEGGRNLHGDKEPQTGVALLASLGKAPVVPAAIVGNERLTPGHKMKVAFGPPLTFVTGERKATREELAKFTGDVMGAIDALKRTIGGNS
jgi:1-acyl-sn-glycerol-3-phosphate acyltransferase